METAAFLSPVFRGVKVTLILQLPFGRTEPLQLLLWPKSPLFVPVILIEVMVRLMLPVFVRVVTFGWLVIPTVWFPKVNIVGESMAMAPCTTCCNTGEVLGAKFASPL